MYIYIYICVCLCVCVCVFVCVGVISELHSFEGQSNLPVHLQQERFGVKSNRHRRVFAWRHLEASQYVAQSGLHLHKTEPHSCKENKWTVVRYFEMQVDFPSHWAHRPLHLKIFFMAVITDITISADARIQTSLTSRFSS